MARSESDHVVVCQRDLGKAQECDVRMLKLIGAAPYEKIECHKDMSQPLMLETQLSSAGG